MDSLNTMMQGTANENAVGLRRICKRSDQPKMERLVNNDARLILRGKLNRTVCVCPHSPYRGNDMIFLIFPIVPCHAFCM